MTYAERVAEITRILGIFNQGCGNTVVPPAPATECEECTVDVLERIMRVAFCLPHDAKIAIVEHVVKEGDTVTVERQSICNLPDWAQEIYGG